MDYYLTEMKLGNNITQSQIHTMLYNIDKNAVWQRQGDTVYVVSQVKMGNSQKIDMTFKVGDILTISWMAHPVVRGKTNQNGYRIPMDKMPEYIARKAEQNGFMVLENRTTIQNTGYVYLEHKNIYLYSNMIFGTIKITDTDKFIRAITEGVRGTSKRCYGFSMLNIWA